MFDMQHAVWGVKDELVDENFYLNMTHERGVRWTTTTEQRFKPGRHAGVLERTKREYAQV
jgi:hypothetical protein